MTTRVLPSKLRAATIDQVLSSASNMVLTVTVALESTAAEFGRFALISSALLLALGGARSFIAEPILIGREPPPHVRRVAAQLALIVSIALAGIDVASGSFGPAAIVAVGGLPLLIQDTARHRAPRIEAWRAAAADGLWLVVQLGALATAALTDLEGAVVGPVGWLVGLGCSIAVLVPFVRTVGDDTSERSLTYERRLLLGYMIGPALLYTGLGAQWLAAGLTAIAATRVVDTMYSPLNTLVGGVRLWWLTEDTSTPGWSRRQASRAASLFTACYAAALIVFERTIGAETVFGEAGDELTVVLVLLSIRQIVGAPLQIDLIHLQRVLDAGGIVRLRTVQLLANCVIPFALALTFGSLEAVLVGSIVVVVIARLLARFQIAESRPDVDLHLG